MCIRDRHMAEVFRRWHTHPEVVNGRWPATVEQCFGLAPRYACLLYTSPLDMGAGVGLVLGDDLIGMFIAQHMAGEVRDHKADGGGCLLYTSLPAGDALRAAGPCH